MRHRTTLVSAISGLVKLLRWGSSGMRVEIMRTSGRLTFGSQPPIAFARSADRFKCRESQTAAWSSKGILESLWGQQILHHLSAIMPLLILGEARLEQ